MNIIRNILFLLLTISASSDVYSGALLDSLVKELEKTTNEKSKAILLLNISWELQYSNPDSAIALCRQAITMAQPINARDLVASAYNNIGFAYYIKGDLDEGLKNHLKALDIRKEINQKNSIAASYGNIGVYYELRGNTEKALYYYFKALRVFYELKDMKRVSAAVNNIGNIYHLQGNYPKALRCFLTVLKVDEKTGDKRGVAVAIHNAGLVYSDMNDYQKAEDYFNRSFNMYYGMNDFDGMVAATSNLGNIYLMQDKPFEAEKRYLQMLVYLEKTGDKRGYATAYNNLAEINRQKKDYGRALEYAMRALEIREKSGDKKGIVSSLIVTGNIYESLGQYRQAEENYYRALTLAKEEHFLKQIKGVYESLNGLYDYLYYSGKDSRDSTLHKAYLFYKLFRSASDSLLNEDRTKSIARIETRYEFEKKMAVQKSEYEKKQVIAREEARRKNIILASVILLFVITASFGFYIFTRYRVIRYQKKLIEIQKKHLETANADIYEKKRIIEEKNKDITDSITYAKRIQEAIMPSMEDLEKIGSESFIFHRQRDIIGGDFYFITDINGWKIIALADCTGHGVPGALMSMLGKNLLSEIVNDRQVTMAGHALDILNVRVTDALNPDKIGELKVKDGMDIAFLAMKGEEVQFAGAGRPLLVYTNGLLNRIPGDERCIGGERGGSQNFITHFLKAGTGTVLYLFTDGFADQIGGPKQKKFKTRNLLQLLSGIASKPMAEQRQIVEKTFLDWKMDYEQTDDVTIIGIRR